MKEENKIRFMKEGDLGAYENRIQRDSTQVSEVTKAKALYGKWKVYRMACKYLDEHSG